MFRKECRDTLKILFQCLTILLAYPAFRMLDLTLGYPQWDFKGAWDFLYTIFAIIFASYSGAALFASEKADRALEYLYSLPVSRGFILVNKIGSRFLVLTVVYLLGMLTGALSNPVTDGLSLLFLFFVAMSVSLAVNSILVGLLGVLILQLILFFSSLIIQYVQMGLAKAIEPAGIMVSFLLPAFIIGIPVLLAFWVSFKQMDLKPREYQVKPYLWIALPPVILALVFVVTYYRSFAVWIKL